MSRWNTLTLLVIFLLSGFYIAYIILRGDNTRSNGEEGPENTLKLYDKGLEPINACSKTIVNQTECRKLLGNQEKPDKLMFPIQMASGAPGSGNDWLLWMASPNNYTEKNGLNNPTCLFYLQVEQISSQLIMNTSCLFMKTHEPWYQDSLNPNKVVVRAALLLRHPYDAAFALYKWIITNKGSTIAEQKSANEGLTRDKIIDPSTNATQKDFISEMELFMKRWLSHCQFWLLNYTKPLHLLIYNDLIEDTVNEVENMQEFFGYHFNGANFRRHCCVMKDTMKPHLKRKKSILDDYKEFVYNRESGIKSQAEEAVKEVDELLDRKFPGRRHQIRRG